MVTEWTLRAGKAYGDPFNDVTLDAVFTGPDGSEQVVPGFWAGEDLWSVRFASPVTGTYRFRTVCSETGDAGLHGREGGVEIFPYRGDNPLYLHGPVRVAANQRYLEHADGTPFFWLADTWWMGLTKRLTWPGGFQTLAVDRVEKGFSVIQIVAGLYPDMDWYDERGANDAGYPWEQDFSRINPEYFNAADRRLRYLVDMGLAPCLVGCWGYFLPWMGVEKLKEHWRYLVARYGAYPTFWCLAGEWDMGYYLSGENAAKNREMQRSAWAEISRYVHEIDGFHRLVSVHEGSPGRELGDGLIDFHMMQTGHGDRNSVPNTVRRVSGEYATAPTLPVIDSEVCYEGIGEACRQEVQRLLFWVCLLSGACGHTYGANGIWQFNTREKPYGPSPHGMTWGNTPWEDAYQLLGSRQVGLAKGLLERYPWWKFEPHPEWIEPGWSEEDFFAGYAAGIPGQVRVIFLPFGRWGKLVKGLEPGVSYRAFLWNPADGAETPLGPVVANAEGDYELFVYADGSRHTMPPIFQDWVLVLEAQ
jgi:hypothetical protein